MLGLTGYGSSGSDGSSSSDDDDAHQTTGLLPGLGAYKTAKTTVKKSVPISDATASPTSKTEQQDTKEVEQPTKQAPSQSTTNAQDDVIPQPSEISAAADAAAVAEALASDQKRKRTETMLRHGQAMGMSREVLLEAERKLPRRVEEGECAPAALASYRSYVATAESMGEGRNFVEEQLLKKRDFHNPSILSQFIEFLGIDQHASGLIEPEVPIPVVQEETPIAVAEVSAVSSTSDVAL